MEGVDRSTANPLIPNSLDSQKAPKAPLSPRNALIHSKIEEGGRTVASANTEARKLGGDGVKQLSDLSKEMSSVKSEEISFTPPPNGAKATEIDLNLEKFYQEGVFFLLDEKGETLTPIDHLTTHPDKLEEIFGNKQIFSFMNGTFFVSPEMREKLSKVKKIEIPGDLSPEIRSRLQSLQPENQHQLQVSVVSHSQLLEFNKRFCEHARSMINMQIATPPTVEEKESVATEAKKIDRLRPRVAVMTPKSSKSPNVELREEIAATFANRDYNNLIRNIARERVSNAAQAKSAERREKTSQEKEKLHLKRTRNEEANVKEDIQEDRIEWRHTKKERTQADDKKIHRAEERKKKDL